MKRTVFTFLLTTISILYSCKKDTNIFTLAVDVQASFNQDSVQVFIDGQKLIDKRLQTDYTISLCPVEGQIVTTENEGDHEIKVIVNNSITRTETFSLHNTLYIGVNYNQQQSEIWFIYSNQRFIYD